MMRAFRLPGGTRHHPAVSAWFSAGPVAMRRLVEPWFECMRACRPDVREILHDGQPTACVDDIAFGYVDAFSGHANVGFFNGVGLDDPSRLLQGTGRHMRHVKLRPDQDVDGRALRLLIETAYRDARSLRDEIGNSAPVPAPPTS